MLRPPVYPDVARYIQRGIQVGIAVEISGMEFIEQIKYILDATGRAFKFFVLTTRDRSEGYTQLSISFTHGRPNNDRAPFHISQSFDQELCRSQSP